MGWQRSDVYRGGRPSDKYFIKAERLDGVLLRIELYESKRTIPDVVLGEEEGTWLLEHLKGILNDPGR